MEPKTPDSGGRTVRGEQSRLVRQFFLDHRTQLLLLAARMVGRQHAEDVAQEAFVRLAERIAHRPLPDVMALLRSPPDLRKLMYRITACRAFEHLRRRPRWASAAPADDDPVPITDDAAQRLQVALDAARVERAYASLAPMQRIAHVLHYYYGFTDSDFKLTLGISKANSRTLVCRANRALKRALEER
jgi:DNA-directed RNA polymerase specialized sigma24 family protein